ncbi:hypothetical protein [Micromonospora coxensis]|uniref:LSU ribosomal protein L12P homologue n=1 Tax=Micromonospora coxensis TaxID=356852 RepID=A0A1C5JM35_9ACTN|nr:hypothetical protein [Micromonospora coxensis]SCG71620.1 LSU ribosomal protein L12P homologue [Micromonospora coxensis]
MESTLAILLVLALTLLLAQTARPGRRDATALRLAEIERRLDLVMRHLGVVDPGPALPGVRAHLARGEKIQAIKAYREATGADLRTAKEAVEAMAEGR